MQNASEQSEEKTAFLLKAAANLASEGSSQVLLDADVKKLHITKCTDEACLRSCLLKIADCSGSMKNHATLLMLFYFKPEELKKENVNARGRTMRGEKEEKEALDSQRMKIIFDTIRKAYANSSTAAVFKISPEWAACIKAMNAKLNFLRNRIIII